MRSSIPFILLAIMLFGAVPAYADTITFEFRGVVNTVTGTAPGSPQVGDLVVGHFSYDLSSVGVPHSAFDPALMAYYHQTIAGGFSLSIGSTHFISSDYTALVANGVGPEASASPNPPPWDAFSVGVTQYPSFALGFQTNKDILPDVKLPLVFDFEGWRPGLDAVGLVVDTGWRIDFTLESITPGPSTSVPEPSSLLLLSTGIIGLIGYGWRRCKPRRRTLNMNPSCKSGQIH